MKTPHLLNQNAAAEGYASLNRRHFLRGLGACLALPAFESLNPLGLLGSETKAVGQLATTPTGAPLRTAFVYFPNGAIQDSWWPKGDEQDPRSRRQEETEQ